MDSTKHPSTIVIVPERLGATRLGIGARDQVQAWLGLTLPVLTIEAGVLTGHLAGLANVKAVARTLE